jgi:hypothetical protein
MSNVYNLEPPVKGKVGAVTTHPSRNCADGCSITVQIRTCPPSCWSQGQPRRRPSPERHWCGQAQGSRASLRPKCSRAQNGCAQPPSRRHAFRHVLPCVTQVTLKTTLGDIDIELWAKEAPKVGSSALHHRHC